MYNHEKQYRCTIIRGKSQKEMDDLLPAYAKVIDEICPCLAEEFEMKFNNAFQHYLPESERIKKTLDNHRTEISGKLFGMYFSADDGRVYESERTQKYLEDNDQPAFFKDMCYKMQFPNGTQKASPTVAKRVSDKICIRPNAFLIKLLLIAQTANVRISKREIGYYVLNSLDVLQGKASPYEVLEAIIKDQKSGIERKVFVQGKEPSYYWQHIKEQMNYLELANLIRFTDDMQVILNPNETATIELFGADWDKKPEFDVYSYDLSTKGGRKSFQFAWDAYFATLSSNAKTFDTSANALIVDMTEVEKPLPKKETSGINLTEFGDEGENIVFEYEKKRVAAFNQRLVNKVLSLGKTKGLGYDIQSVIAEPGDMAEFVKYIEVKSTKRFTAPNFDDGLWVDTLNMTRNEWIAAQQHGAFYSIFRVYFTKEGIVMFILTNISQKLKDGQMQAVPTTYRVDFNNSAVDSVVSPQVS
ncbi:MAG: DUF3883 domain-containing protein [Odoribacter sp.]